MLLIWFGWQRDSTFMVKALSLCVLLSGVWLILDILLSLGFVGVSQRIWHASVCALLVGLTLNPKRLESPHC